MKTCDSGKSVFTSKHQAKRGLRALKSPQGRMHPYPCGDHWHLGHSDKVEAKRGRMTKR